MYRQLIAACSLTGALLLSACSPTAPVSHDVSIIPIPKEIKNANGEFTLKDGMTIGVADKQLLPAANYLSGLLSRSTGYIYNVREGDGDISLAVSDIAGQNEGAYTLDVSSGKVQIKGNTYGGVISGIESLRQLLPAEIESPEVVSDITWSVPAVQITDAPRFGWRGLMLDVSRHFYTKEEVKELLDMMALYKLNKFHWHLTDDQGWRVEIKKYPLLTEKGAWRTFNNHDRECMRLAKVQDNPDYEIPAEKLRITQGDTLYGGFYTQNDIKEIVEYAGVRGIDVIPEIDMPGHMLAAVSNYAGVSCFSQTGWGTTFSSPVCPGKDSALEFCKNVYSEIIPLFPYKYIHLGADEVEKTNWKKCPDCQKRMKDNGLKTEEELQAWFVHDMEKFFNENGKEMIGWDEILEGGLSPTATIMWWRSWHPQSVPDATAQGNHAIMSPNTNFYFDYQQDKNSLPGVYNFNPMLESLNDAQKALILGIQANLWCEYIPSFERAQYMIMPRMMALSEQAWSDPSVKSWDGFTERLVKQFPRLNIMGVNYRMPDLEGFNNTNAFIGEGNVTITCLDPSVEIHYTTDGSIPTLESPRYTEPIKVTETTDFTFRTFRPNGKKGDIVKTRYIKSEYAPAAEATPSKKGLQAVWHEFKGNKCAGIEKAPVNGTYEISEVTIPAEAKGNIGLVISGYFNAPEDAIYTFNLISDDGSTLTIDGEQVVDNDGPHSVREVTGQKALAKGLHPIQVKYFDNNGGMLQLKVMTADGKEIPANTNMFAY
ncbi:family 20 glycosylhydrolase [Parabacteroides gordonii]|jgi:hexosaminidase|uniref:family 20 glycosylhydrolase n=1 Tax=Parabacteroides gordonii TaxID=574930 RepID=UPI00241D22A2|nr:family 20 glycosylhydrolase [Parabacteroides gordonii]